MLSAQNLTVRLSDGEMDAIRFGSGEKCLIMIPGLGDGLKTVKGMALPFAMMYRSLSKDFTVYVFSRRTVLPPHMTTREMASDVSEAINTLGITHARVLGISQGGMIAQWLALDHPEQVEKLVLAVTLSRPNATVRQVISGWTEMAKADDYQGIMLDTAEKSYTPKRVRQAQLASRLMGNLGRPASFDRFLIQAESCLTHDTFSRLHEIQCPVLVIGGTEDRIVTGEASQEIAGEIPGASLYLYPGLGHGLYEEAPDFFQRVSQFCQ